MKFLKEYYLFILGGVSVAGIIALGYLTLPERTAHPVVKNVDWEVEYTAVQELKYLTAYHRCIDSIIAHEGFRRTPYQCAAGKWTIGIGHGIKPGERFTRLTIGQAHQLMKQDFDLCIEWAERYGFERRDGRQLAVAHAMYCMGVGTVYDLVQSGFPQNVTGYCHYRSGKTGEMVFSPGGLRSRKFELELWNQR